MKVLLMILTLAVGAYSQIIISGNPTCASLGFTSSFKIDPPRAGTFPIQGVGTVTTTINSPQTLSWTSSSPAFVRAVIMKAGPQANVYFYNPPATGGDLLNTGSQAALSHVDFCYSLSPTAASVSVSGRVTDFYGKPIYQARVSIVNASNGEVKTAISNPFGFYRIDGLEVSNIYQVSVTARRYTFIPLTLNLQDELTGYDLVATY